MELQTRHIMMFALFLLMGAASSVHAADQSYDDRWYIAPQLTYVWADSKRNVDNGSGLRLDVGKPLSESWNLEFGINDYKLDYTGPLPGSSHQTSYGLNGLWFFNDRPRAFSPFLLMGLGLNEQNPEFSNSSSNAYGTLGAGFLSSPWTWNGAIRVSVQHIKMIGNGNFGDTIASIGLQIPFGATYEAPPSPAPPSAVPVSGGMPTLMSPELEQVPRLPHVIELKGVKFAHDSDVLLPESSSVLDEAVMTLNDHPEVLVEVAGHTDNVGDAAYNMGLSQRRAEAVEKYLIDHGIAASRLSAKGYGEDDPIATNDTPEGRAENRRVELRIQGNNAGN